MATTEGTISVPRKTRFDTAERAGIRAAMLAYMQAHRIGVPAMQARVADAAGRSIDLIPLKTLQRFLAGATRTNDAFLIPCHMFASSLPDHGRTEQTAPDSFAHALAVFFRRDAEPPAAPSGLAEPAIAGTYQVLTEMRQPGLRIYDPGAAFDIPYARFALADGAGEASLQAQEEVFNPAGKRPFRERDGAPSHRYEGAALGFNPLIFVMLRNKVTRLPKTYWLRRHNEETLYGQGLEARFIVEARTPGASTAPVNFVFARIAQGAPS